MTGSLSSQSAVRSLTLDDVRVTYAVDGAMWLARTAFFPKIPDQYWAEHPEATDAEGRVAMSAGGLLVERAGRHLLIDAGMGVLVGPIQVGPLTIGASDTGALPDTLARLGVALDQVDTVAFTHIHVDHTGWAFDTNGTKVFPNARYVLAGQEWAPHGRGETIPGAPGRSVVDLFAADHVAVGDGEEVFPGVHTLITPGHSPGHTSYVISTPTARVIAFGDVFHVPAQISHPEWPSAPDVDADAVVVARRRLVEELERPGTVGFSCHFGDQPFGRVVRDDNGTPRWEPVGSTVVLPAPRA